MTQRECKGCTTYDYDEALQEGTCLEGLNPHISNTKQCPCLNCIVKMICEDGCINFRRYCKLDIEIKIGGTVRG